MVSYGAVESARDTFSKYKVGSNISNDFSYPSFTLKQNKTKLSKYQTARTT